MSKPKLILHIGTHKTGSSALQSFFRRNFEILSSKGFTWINDSYLWGKIGVAPEDEISPDYIEAIQKQIYEAAESTQNTLILSSEAFSGDVYRAYNNARFSAEVLKKILDQFSVQVVLYLRRQDIFYESWYIQKIQEGHTYSFNDFYQTLDFKNVNWEPIIRHFTEAFGASQMTIRLYEKNFLKDGNIINDFTDVVMGFPNLEGFNEPNWSNRGMNLESLRVMRHLNQLVGDSQQRNQIRFFLQQNFPRNLFDDFQILSPGQRKQILLYFQPFNQYLCCDLLSLPKNIFEHEEKDEETKSPYLDIDEFNMQELTNFTLTLLLDFEAFQKQAREMENEKVSTLQETLHRVRRQKANLFNELTSLQETAKALEESIEVMKSSKFWKLRDAWIALRSKLIKN